MAADVQKRNQKERIVVERGVAVILLTRFVAAIEEQRSECEQSAGKQFPGTREKCTGLGDRSGGRGDECGAGDISGRGNNEKRTSGFAARLARCRQEALNAERGQDKHGKKCAADHPAHWDMRQSNGTGMEIIA